MVTRGAHRARRFSFVMNLRLTLAILVVAGLLVAVPNVGSAAGTTVAEETATLANTTDWVEIDGVQEVSNDASSVDEIQTLYNGATGGTFTVSFDGQGPTGDIGYNGPINGVAAQATLTMDTQPSDGDTYTIDNKTYTFQTTLTDVDGNVAIGGSLAQAQLNLVAAMDLSGSAGTDYATSMTAHTTVDAAAFSGNNCVLTAKLTGTVGNSYPTTETFTAGTNVFDAATLGATTAGVNGLKHELEKLSNITSVGITGSGTSGDPWLITFTDPGSQDLPLITTNDTNLTGGTPTSTISTTTEGWDGGSFTLSFDGQTTAEIAHNAAPATVKTVLESLANIYEVTVIALAPLPPGATNGWEVTFIDRAAQAMTATDSFSLGETTTITVSERGLSVPIDPSGIAWMSDIEQLLVADSEIDEEGMFFDGVNVWEMNRDGSFPTTTYTGVSPDPPTKIEPTGLAYDPATGNVFFTNDFNPKTVTIVEVGADGHFGSGDDVLVGSFDTAAYGDMDLEDVAFDSSTGHLFLAGGVGDVALPDSPQGTRPRYVYEVSVTYGPVVATLVQKLDVSKFDASGVPAPSVAAATYVIRDVEGIEYRAPSDTLLFTDASQEVIYEMTRDGYLLRQIDVAGAIGGGHVLADIALAPASAGGETNMYVVDRGQDPGPDDTDKPPLDGKLYEFSVPFDNLAPFVDAGLDQGITTLVASLDGTAFDDGQPLGGLTTTWSKSSGPGTVTFGDASLVDTTATFSAAGTYVLQLAGDDTVNTLSTDTVTIIVNAAPVVDAGTDQVVTYPAGANLDGTVTDDGLPDPPATVTTLWTKFSGPGTVTFGDDSAVDTTATFSAAGVYVLRLTADDTAAAPFDDVQITVNGAPVVDAGTDQVVTYPAGANLDGTVTDDGLPDPPATVTTLWTKFSGPGTVTFGDDSAVDTTATFSAAGVYVLELQADDGDTTATDTVTITVAAGGGGGGGAPPPPSANTFTDDDGNPHEANIEAIAALGITEGCNPPVNDKFCPELNVTRAEMAVFLVQAMGEADNLPTYQGYFSDVAAGAWYAPWVERLYQLGVTVGFPDGSYHPDGTVTRGEMAVFLVTAFDHVTELIPPTGVFGDVDLAAFYADDAELIKRLGITAGCSTNPLNYCPNSPVRRDHMATFLAKALGL